MAACLICKQLIAVPDAHLPEANLQHFVLAHQAVMQELGPLIGKFAQMATLLFLCGGEVEGVAGRLADSVDQALAQIREKAQALVQCPDPTAAAAERQTGPVC
jgi:hypothetical protein